MGHSPYQLLLLFILMNAFKAMLKTKNKKNKKNYQYYSIFLNRTELQYIINR